MKIVHVIPSFNVGGGELLAVRLCRELKNISFANELYIVSLYNKVSSVVYDEATISGAKIITLNKKKGLDLSVLARMVFTLISIKPDVLHTHLAGLRYSIFAGIFLRKTKKVHTVHTIATRESFGVVKYLHWIAYKYMGWLPVALSSTIKKTIKDVYGVDSYVVSNGVYVDEKYFRCDRLTYRKTLGLPEDKTILTTVGRLSPEKNHLLLLDVFEILCETSNDIVLNIVGDTLDSEYKETILNKIENLPAHVKNNINFLGFRKDIPEILLSSDIFVMASNWEGVPLTLIEAMGYGLPVVCTSVGGIPDVVDNGVTGVLVKSGDAKKMAESIYGLMLNKEYASRLARQAMLSVKESYSIKKTAYDYMRIYTL